MNVGFVYPSAEVHYSVDSPLVTVQANVHRYDDDDHDCRGPGRLVARSIVYVWDGDLLEDFDTFSIAADDQSRDLSELASLIESHSDALDDLACVDTYGFATRVVVIDEVFVEPDVRGRGLGAQAAAVALHAAGVGATDQAVVAALAGAREEGTDRDRVEAAAAGILERVGLHRVNTTILYLGDSADEMFRARWLNVLDSIWEGRTSPG
jgi:GNAT superfamily N-acetyltransferase